jgi:hypothetical protein
MKRCNYAFLPMDIQQHLTLSVDYVNNYPIGSVYYLRIINLDPTELSVRKNRYQQEGR